LYTRWFWAEKDEIGYIVKEEWFYRLFVQVHRIAGNYIIRSLLVFNMPRYNYEFYSLVTRKIANFLIPEMYVSMTIQEEDVGSYFSPQREMQSSTWQVGQGGKVVAIEAHPESCCLFTDEDLQ
jgi:hypothetical protein